MWCAGGVGFGVLREWGGEMGEGGKDDREGGGGCVVELR